MDKNLPQWSTRDLEEALRRETLTPGDPDPDFILAASQALLDREADPIQTQEAWDRFQARARAKHRPGKRKKTLRVWLAAALLAAFSVVGAAAVSLHAQAPWGEAVDSPQIARCGVSLQEEEGQMVVRFSVTGRGEVTALGAERITLCREEAGQWVTVVSYPKDSLGLWTDQGETYTGSFTCRSQQKDSYRVTVTLFAENEAGYDTWTETVESPEP
jgi:hypothetical protein